jgi:hypothetical protein
MKNKKTHSDKNDDKKKEIIFNALNDGWEVKKISDNKTDCSSYCFTKKTTKSKVCTAKKNVRKCN